MNRKEVISELEIRIKKAEGGIIPVTVEAMESIVLLLKEQRKIGKWIQTEDSHDYVTPGGTPYYVCSLCGGTGHLHGAEFSKRKLFCDNCGAINSYPWEKIYDEGAYFAK